LLSALLAEHVNDGGLALVVAHHELDLAAAVRRLELTE
jgi:ABC-type transport system involved in cytochrome c biogenesis ATPase subunit